MELVLGASIIDYLEFAMAISIRSVFECLTNLYSWLGNLVNMVGMVGMVGMVDMRGA